MIIFARNTPTCVFYIMTDNNINQLIFIRHNEKKYQILRCCCSRTRCCCM